MSRRLESVPEIRASHQPTYVEAVLWVAESHRAADDRLRRANQQVQELGSNTNARVLAEHQLAGVCSAAQESRSKSLGKRRIDDVVRYLGLAAPVAKVLFVSCHCKFLELCYFGCL